MVRTKKWALWTGAASTIIAVVLALYAWWIPHPVRGPALPVDGGRIHKSSANLAAQFPKLAAGIQETVSTRLPDPGESSGDAAPVSISGSVLDADTGSGIAGAWVHLKTQSAAGSPSPGLGGEFTAETEAGGRYRTAEIRAEGKVVMFATAEGFSPQVSELDLLRPGRVYDNVDFTLKRAIGQIAGHVVDTRHTPIPGAVVEVITGPEGAGGIAVTDEVGAFTVALPAEGQYVLLVGKEGFGSERFIDIRPGMERLELILEEGGGIAGTVTNKKGEPRPGLKVFVEVEPSGQSQDVGESLWRSETVTDADGRYRVGDLSAHYTYRVRVTIRVSPGATRATSGREGLEAYVQSVKEMEGKFTEFIYSRSPDAGLARQ
ncbi:MAG: carboxypeptidase regulatory-like domain-containing protein [Candidatus Hydrogenedentes bacterium]|nr:carboxypeptidase regulatory-like domain-containing protein [Candidatus Hydrogenedentota bacterium]